MSKTDSHPQADSDLAYDWFTGLVPELPGFHVVEALLRPSPPLALPPLLPPLPRKLMVRKVSSRARRANLVIGDGTAPRHQQYKRTLSEGSMGSFVPLDYLGVGCGAGTIGSRRNSTLWDRSDRYRETASFTKGYLDWDEVVLDSRLLCGMPSTSTGAGEPTTALRLVTRIIWHSGVGKPPPYQRAQRVNLIFLRLC